jgi:hypothetical protein
MELQCCSLCAQSIKPNRDALQRLACFQEVHACVASLSFHVLIATTSDHPPVFPAAPPLLLLLLLLLLVHALLSCTASTGNTRGSW